MYPTLVESRTHSLNVFVASSLTLRQRFNIQRFLRGERYGRETITLNHRRIFILPTRAGLGFFLLLLLLWLTSANYNNNLGYILAYLLASMGMVSIIHAYRQLAELKIHPENINPVFAGEKALFTLAISNPSSRRREAVTFTHPLAGSQQVSFDSNDTRKIQIPLSSHRRGKFKVGTVTLATVYPLGLFRAWAPLNFDLEWWVYPKPAANSLPLPQNQKNRQQSREATDRDFEGFKTYQPGDSLKQIHWKGLAKGQGLHSKQFQDEPQSNEDLWLDWQKVPGKDTEARLSQLCRWLLEAEQSRKRYGLTMPLASLPPDQGKKHLHACLQLLAVYPHG